MTGSCPATIGFVSDLFWAWAGQEIKQWNKERTWGEGQNQSVCLVSGLDREHKMAPAVESMEERNHVKIPDRDFNHARGTWFLSWSEVVVKETLAEVDFQCLIKYTVRPYMHVKYIRIDETASFFVFSFSTLRGDLLHVEMDCSGWSELNRIMFKVIFQMAFIVKYHMR